MIFTLLLVVSSWYEDRSKNSAPEKNCPFVVPNQLWGYPLRWLHPIPMVMVLLTIRMTMLLLSMVPNHRCQPLPRWLLLMFHNGTQKCNKYTQPSSTGHQPHSKDMPCPSGNACAAAHFQRPPKTSGVAVFQPTCKSHQSRSNSPTQKRYKEVPLILQWSASGARTRLARAGLASDYRAGRGVEL